jgi:hypothetical protein
MQFRVTFLYIFYPASLESEHSQKCNETPKAPLLPCQTNKNGQAKEKIGDES